jgi:hypothetical protein
MVWRAAWLGAFSAFVAGGQLICAAPPRAEAARPAREARVCASGAPRARWPPPCPRRRSCLVRRWLAGAPPLSVPSASTKPINNQQPRPPNQHTSPHQVSSDPLRVTVRHLKDEPYANDDITKATSMVRHHRYACWGGGLEPGDVVCLWGPADNAITRRSPAWCVIAVEGLRLVFC